MLHWPDMARRDRYAKIQDPRQRLLARRIGEVCDVFSEHFAGVAPGKRLVVASGRAGTDASATMRAAFRTLALGMTIALGRDVLGLPLECLHGLAGRTEVDELRDLHRATVLLAERKFRALAADRGELGKLTAVRYRQISKSLADEYERLPLDEKLWARKGSAAA